MSGGNSIHIRVKNDSLAPLLGPKLDRELRKNILRNSVFELVNDQDQADLYLLVTLRTYEDYSEAFQSEDTLLAAGLNLQTTARMELSDSKGINLYEDNVEADSSVLRRVSTHVPDDAMALQALAESLASKISLSLYNQAW